MRVSCLMVTLPTPQRLAGLIAAVTAFGQQTHADKELIVVVDHGDPRDRNAVMAAIARAQQADVSIIAPGWPMTLGALRNLSIQAATGSYVCQWDDDDLHHPCRVAEQLAAPASGACAATLLADVMLHEPAAHKLYWTNWAATPAGGHPGTLLCARDAMPRYPETGPEAALSEDLALLIALRRGHAVQAIAGRPHLYGYTIHGTNVSPSTHLAMVRDRLSISRGLLMRREQVLREGLSPFQLAGTTVEGANGRAFTL